MSKKRQQVDIYLVAADGVVFKIPGEHWIDRDPDQVLATWSPLTPCNFAGQWEEAKPLDIPIGTYQYDEGIITYDPEKPNERQEFNFDIEVEYFLPLNEEE